MAREVVVTETELFDLAYALNVKGVSGRAKRMTLERGTDHGTVGDVHQRQCFDVPRKGRVEIPHGEKRARQGLEHKRARRWELDD